MSKVTPTLFLALIAVPAYSQMQDNQSRTLTCNDRNHRNDRLVGYCEIKEQTFGAPNSAIVIDPGTNGGVTVKGWSRPDLLVRARIDTSAPSEAEARSLVPQIQFASGGGQLKTSGPSTDRDHNWSVTYEIFVPHQSDIDARSHNGGMRIQDVKGRITFSTINGGANLARLSGDVSGKTVNGGLTIELMGTQWDGKGMDVATTNGGVKMSMPANYSARVETATVNGNINVDFPAAVQGKISKDMSFTVGSGGATIRAVTTNGGVKIEKS